MVVECVRSQIRTFVMIMASRYVSVRDVERAVVWGITDALAMHGVDVPDPAGDDSDSDSRYIYTLLGL